MLKHKLRKITCCLCAAAMLMAAPLGGLSRDGSVAYGATLPKDAKNHWAKSYISTAIDKNIVKGYEDGTFRPDKAVTRAEFAHMLNAALGNNATANVSFSDVASNAWYASDVKKAVSAGYASGYDTGKFMPSAAITRQEAAVMLSRVIPVYNTAASLTKFKDASSVSSWATEPLSRVVGRGYISGSDKGYLTPKSSLTRAQAVVIICKLLDKETIVKTATTVTKDGTKLNDTIYANGVTFSSSFDGDATISNCVILGNLTVADGDSVTVTNSRVANAVLTDNGGAELIAKGESSIKTTTVSGNVQLTSSSVSGKGIFAAGFESVGISKNAEAELTGTFPKVSLDGSGAVLSLKGAKVTTLTIASGASATQVTADGNSSIANANVNGTEAAFKGNGTISVMSANANGITYEKRPSTLTTGKNVTKAPSSVDAGLSITPNPKSGATKVEVDTRITLTFNNAVKLYNGNTVTSSNIDDFVQLRKNTASGSVVKFSASINSAKTVITITPNDDLEEDTKYYVTMAQNKIKDSNGKANASFSTYFTTKDEDRDDTDATFYPKNKASNVSLDVSPTITFSEKVICYDGSTVSNSDLDDIIIFRERNSKGDDIKFSASINSAKTKITISPKYDLDEDTTYYLAIDSKSLKTSAGKEVIPAQSVTWSTEDENNGVSFYPKNKATGVSRSVSPTITFSEAIVDYDGDKITNSYLRDNIIFREDSSSGTKVPFSASINSTKKTITISPDSSLKNGTKYYLGFDSRTFKTSSKETKIPAASVTWTVTGSSSNVYISNTKSTENSISLDVYGSLKGTIYAVLLPSGASTPSADQVRNGKNANGVVVDSGRRANTGTISADTEKKLSFTDLDPDTSYKVCLVLYPSSGSTSSVVSKSVSTSKPSIPAALLSGIDLSKGSLNFSSSKTEYEVSLPNGTEVVTVTATAADNGNISFDGSGTSQQGTSSKEVNVSSGKGTIKITVFDAAKTETTYTINFTVESDTSLNAFTVNGNKVSNNGTYTMKADDGTTATIYIETHDPQAEIRGGRTDINIREEDITVDYGTEMEYNFTVVSTNGVRKEYTITIVNPPLPESDNGGDTNTSSGAIS